MTSKNNVNINFKDMNHVNNYGILEGINISGFLIQFWGLIIDLMILGIDRAIEI
jgi:pre-mRNA-processing factor 8